MKIIAVGNLNTGGTGKTPFTELLIEAFQNKYKIAVLSRGYGRKSKGLRIVDTISLVEEVGDESLQIKQKFPEIMVMVCENRVEGIKELESPYFDIDLVILDDAFQHRYIHRDINILLTDFKRPFYRDFALPTGNLREWRNGKSRADVIIVSKGPENLKSELKEKMISNIQPNKNQSCFFGFNGYGEISNLLDNSNRDIGEFETTLVVSGIAHGKDFYEYAATLTASSTHLNFQDHVNYDRPKIDKIVSKFKSLNGNSKTAIITTRKDAVKLQSFREELNNIPVFILDYKFQIHAYSQCIELIESKIMA